MSTLLKKFVTMWMHNAHDLETRSRANNKSVIPRFPNSKSQNGIIFSGMRSLTTSPKGNKHLINFVSYMKYLKFFFY